MLATGEAVYGMLREENLELPLVVDHVLAHGDEQSAWPQHPGTLRQCGVEVRDVVQDLAAVDDVDRLGGDRKPVAVGRHRHHREVASDLDETAESDDIAQIRFDGHDPLGVGRAKARLAIPVPAPRSST